MRKEIEVVSELKSEIIGYLKRERERAARAAGALPAGSMAQIENSARLHQIGTILFIVGSVFRRAERTLDQSNQAEEASREEGGKEGSPKA